MEEKLVISDNDDAMGPMQIASQEELVKRLKALQCFQNMGKKFWDECLKTGEEVFCEQRLIEKSFCPST